MRTAEYWVGRFEKLEKTQNANALKYVNRISKEYERAIRSLNNDISYWYTRYAKENGVTYTEAKRLLSSKELEAFRMDVKEYIEKGESLDPKWRKQLEQASAKVHVSRLEALKLQVQQAAESVSGKFDASFGTFGRNIYTEQYYKTAFEIQKGLRVGWELSRLNKSVIDKVIRKPWAADGRNFSERVWANRSKLVNELHTQLTQSIIRGDSPDKAIAAISKRMKVSKNAAGRLIMTESAFFSSAATQDAYKTLEVEKYEILATLDSLTSEICRDMDGKIFDRSDYRIGVSAPPFHPYCRTTTVPYFDDDEGGKRAARDSEGKYYTVPDDMTYRDWEKAFVEGGSKEGLETVKDVETLAKLAGVIKGDPMTREQANSGKVNPQFNESEGYKNNCQTCVVAYEARLRGYDVTALPFKDGSMLDRLSRHTNLAWIDPATGEHPEYIKDDKATTPKKFLAFLEKVVQSGSRYTLQFGWRGRRRMGHIVSLDRDDNNVLRLYDPQNGVTYSYEQLKQYLTRLRYTMTIYGEKLAAVPKLMKIDELEFDTEVVNEILKGAK